MSVAVVLDVVDETKLSPTNEAANTSKQAGKQTNKLGHSLTFVKSTGASQ